ncbi:MAG: heavy metal-associated domain-containing protein, partial [Anaerolineae bacterium]|nr:heavy metal-associated domain-containing protein [Anaerolineae bacterium]
METSVNSVGVRSYNVAGLSCIDCSGRIQASVSQLQGVEKCAVDHTTGKITIWLSEPDLDVDAVQKIVKNTGHELITEHQRIQSRHPVIDFLRFVFRKTESALT